MEMISELTISNYRGIRSCSLNGLKSINILLGRNNSGKSSILEAIYLASAAVEYRELIYERFIHRLNYLLNRRTDRGFSIERKLGLETLWYNYDQREPIRININFKGDVKFLAELHSFHSHPLIKVKELEGLLCLMEGSLYDETLKIKGHVSKNDIIRLYEPVINFMSNTVFIDSSLIYDFKQVEVKLWRNVLKERQDKLIAELISEGYDVKAEGLTYVPYDGGHQLVIVTPKGYIRVDDLGDGARYAIILLMVLATSKEVPILIEEPESHQHPSGLAETIQFLLNLLIENGLQLFISTHSIEFVRLLYEIAKEKGLEVLVKTFFLERSEDGIVDVREIEAVDMDVLRKLGLDPRLLYII